MSDVLVYWRDYRRNRETAGGASPLRAWHSNSRLLAGLTTGDRLWMVASGRGLDLAPAQAGFLVEVWRVECVIENPGDDAAYRRDGYAWRVLARLDDGQTPVQPRPVDAVIRPRGSAAGAPIGRLLQGPRRLSPDAVERLLAAPRSPDVPSSDGIDRDRIALGVRQPWAELILQGRKTIEVRTLPTNVRGAIYLYTSKVLASVPAARRAIESQRLDVETLPKGLLVGSVEVLDCRPCTRADAEAACVPASLLAGKLAWTLGNPQRLATPLRPRFLPYGVWFYPFRRRTADAAR